MNHYLSIICILIGIVYVESACQFHNPLFPEAEADPWFTFHDGHYYYARSAAGGIQILRSDFLSNWQHAIVKTVWLPPPTGGFSKEIWAPEIHFIGSHWYIYFAGDDGNNNNHRMHVLESVTGDALGAYKFMGTLDTESWAIDGTIMNYRNRLYFIWSGWIGNNDGFPQHIFIAEMSSPFKISSKRVLLASPIYQWEKDGVPNGKGLLEGPEVLVSPKGKYFITYSGAASWTEFYKIGALELRGNNPMNPGDWFHIPNPLFGESRETSVYGTGHASYVKSKDGKQDYIVYHAMSTTNSGWGGRTVRIQEFHWDDKTQYPVFGRPAPLNQALPSPSGECP